MVGKYLKNTNTFGNIILRRVGKFRSRTKTFLGSLSQNSKKSVLVQHYMIN